MRCVFKFLPFEERFGKAPFLWRISVYGNLTVERKLRFNIHLANEVWTLPKSLFVRGFIQWLIWGKTETLQKHVR